VVDTGLHSKQWEKSRALNISWKNHRNQSLLCDPRCSIIKEFHDTALGGGGLPLPELEAYIALA